MLDYSLILNNSFKLNITAFPLFETTFEIMQFFAIQAKLKDIKLIYDIDWTLYKENMIFSDSLRI